MMVIKALECKKQLFSFPDMHIYAHIQDNKLKQTHHFKLKDMSQMCYLCHSFLSHEKNAASLTKKKCIEYLIFQISGAAPWYILAIAYV